MKDVVNAGSSPANPASFKADLAQLVEPHICNMFVIGSNPIVGSIFNEKKQKRIQFKSN